MKKLGDTLIKDYMKRKIDNLKLLLSFYEKDINETISELMYMAVIEIILIRK